MGNRKNWFNWGKNRFTIKVKKNYWNSRKSPTTLPLRLHLDIGYSTLSHIWRCCSNVIISNTRNSITNRPFSYKLCTLEGINHISLLTYFQTSRSKFKVKVTCFVIFVFRPYLCQFKCYILLKELKIYARASLTAFVTAL